jgi:hypothetical protein
MKAACPKEKSPVKPVNIARPKTAIMFIQARVVMERM